MIKFNVPPVVGGELNYIEQAVKSQKICGDGEFTKKCNKWIEEKADVTKALLTTSCTHSLEMAAILLDIKEGDEVILPSYTFVSTANAFVLRGAKLKFVDIRPDTMNINEKLIEEAITDKTKAIVPVHYAGVGCEMDEIMAIADAHNLRVVEDAAQGVNAFYKGKMLGSIGDMGCYSFHETKNYSMGEGGATLFRDDTFVENAEIIREKGTDRSKFFRGQVDKYSWVEMGSSYLPSELNAAYLYAQLEKADEINDNRLATWATYFQELKPLQEQGLIELPYVPDECKHNAHMFYVKLKDMAQRTEFINHLKDNGVSCVFHYVPLHSSSAGKRFGEFSGKDVYTTRESERLARLPMYYSMTEDDIAKTIDTIKKFF
ncbi:MAG: dTDP-4-amino-4,6-dideoxygalactose transaminase [Eubacterium sp.]|nr:dTDP-4-amino-4,6-dideoxygalactose transaminase [Candidatus Colimonas fimequi]